MRVFIVGGAIWHAMKVDPVNVGELKSSAADSKHWSPIVVESIKREIGHLCHDEQKQAKSAEKHGTFGATRGSSTEVSQPMSRMCYHPVISGQTDLNSQLSWR